MAKYLRIWQYFLILIFLGLGLFLLDKYLALDGTLELKYDFNQKPSLISLINPRGRASDRIMNLETGEAYQSLTGDPTYFTVQVPRSYDTAEVTLTYRNPAQQIVELGLQKSSEWQFELKPLENKFLTDSQWSRTTKDSIVLLQKQQNFSSVDEFLQNLPLDQKIATYNYELPYQFKLADYTAKPTGLDVQPGLRGKHELYTYIKDEDLDFTFAFQDLNKNFDVDNFTVQVFFNNQEIYSDYVPDDGDVIADNKISPEQTKQVKLTDLPEGAYKIVLANTDDIQINRLQTAQQLLVVKNHLFLGDGKPSTLYTNIDQLKIKSDHPEGLQTVNLDNQNLAINKVGRYFDFRDSDSDLGEIKKMIIPYNDVLIESEGYYAFTADSFFDPDYSIASLRADTEIEQYDYLIANQVAAPVKVGTWQAASDNFDLQFVPGDRKLLTFLISAPGLDERNDDIQIKEIKVKFSRPNIWQKNNR